MIVEALCHLTIIEICLSLDVSPSETRELGLSDFVLNCKELHSKVFSLRHSQPQEGAAQSSDSFSNHSCMCSRWPPWPHERQIMAWPFTKRSHQTHLKKARNILCVQAVVSVLPHFLFFSFCPEDLNPGLIATFLVNTLCWGPPSKFLYRDVYKCV